MLYSSQFCIQLKSKVLAKKVTHKYAVFALCYGLALCFSRTSDTQSKRYAPSVSLKIDAKVVFYFIVQKWPHFFAFLQISPLCMLLLMDLPETLCKHHHVKPTNKQKNKNVSCKARISVAFLGPLAIFFFPSLFIWIFSTWTDCIIQLQILFTDIISYIYTYSISINMCILSLLLVKKAI